MSVHIIDFYLVSLMLGGIRGKNLPSMQETLVQSLGLEDCLAKGIATHSGILACRVPWAEEPGGL